MFKTPCNLVAIWGKTEVNVACQQEPNCIGMASSLYLQQKLHLKVHQKSHQKSHVSEQAFREHLFLSEFQT